MKSILLPAVAASVLAIAPLALFGGCSQSYADRVVSVGPGELTVSDRWKSAPETHEVAPDAQIVLDGKPAELQDIQPGDSVQVTTETKDGEEVAVKVDAKRSEADDTAGDSGGAGPTLIPPMPSPLPAPFPGPIPESSVPSEEPAPDLREKPSGPESDKPAPAGTDKPGAAEEEKAAGPQPEEKAEALFHGKLERVEPDLLRIEAETDSPHPAATIAFTIAKDAKIQIAGKPARLEDLHEGMTVIVTATKDGDRNIAVRIEAEPARA